MLCCENSGGYSNKIYTSENHLKTFAVAVVETSSKINVSHEFMSSFSTLLTVVLLISCLIYHVAAHIGSFNTTLCLFNRLVITSLIFVQWLSN